MRSMLAGAAVLALVLAGGCAPDASSDRGTTGVDQAGEQSWALGEGVTAEEYRTAIIRFLDCMAEGGYGAGDPVLSPVDGVSLLYELRPSGEPSVYNETLRRCEEANISLIEPAYVEAQDAVMDPALRDMVAKCLTDHGQSLTGPEKNAPDFIRQTGGGAQPTMECVNQGMMALFPTYPRSLSVRW